MADAGKINEFFENYFRDNDQDSLGAAEAAKLLDEAGLLADDAAKPGHPLRDLLRGGDIPGASKEAGRWVIRPSGEAQRDEPSPKGESLLDDEEPDLTEGFAVRDAGDRLPSRWSILIRLLFSLVFLLVFEILRLIVHVALLYQYVQLFITRRPSEPVRSFCNGLSGYAYRVLRFATLCENDKPFPLNPLPEEIEAVDKEVRFE